MQPFPHHYQARAAGNHDGVIRVEGPGLPDIATTAPPEFGGPEGHWSPESLLVASVADCFILSFRAVARASKLDWEELSCDVEAVLERPDGVSRFTRMTLAPRLTIRSPDDEDKAHRCLERTERACLVTNSLTADITLKPQIDVAESA